MSRLPPLAPPYEPAVREELEKLMPPGMKPIGLFRTVAHNARVLGRVRKGGLLDPGSVTLRQREIVILRTTALCRSEYEWGVHVGFFSGAAELTRGEIAATVSGDAAAFPERDRPLIELCDALHREATIDDALHARLAALFRPDQLVELVALAGQYHCISFLTNAFAIELEPGAPRF